MQLTREDLSSLIEWYDAMGVDCALDDSSIDRFAETALKLNAVKNHSNFPAITTSKPALDFSSKGKTPHARSNQNTATVPGSEMVQSARLLASQASTLDEIHQHLKKFEGCNLRQTAKHLCFADGNPNARIMIVAEAPGREEDIAGIPFAGRSGDLLNRMLAAIALDRQNTWLTYCIPWRPPGNRAPTPSEIEVCKPFIERQITILKPELLVFLGAEPAQQLLNVKEGITQLRGKWKIYDTAGMSIDTITTFHPDYLLRSPARKKQSWKDLQAIRDKLKQH